MNPPVREARIATASGAACSRASSTCSAPTTRRTRCEEKAKPYPESPSGMTGVQTLVPVMLDHVNAGRLSLQRFVDLTSAGPARSSDRAQGPHRGGLRRRFHHGRHEAPRDHHRRWIASRAAGRPTTASR
jgi:dihydroorotase